MIEDLKKHKQWVNWIYSETKNGITKVPISPKGKKTGTNKQYQYTWTTFENAKNNKNADGIGLILTNGVCGIDIDKRNINNPIVRDIFNLMDTYTEYSPSGKGFHLLFSVNMEQIPTDILTNFYQKIPTTKLNAIFDRHFSANEQDKNLKKKLKNQDEISGIFNWCLQGLRTYTKSGLNIPEDVKNATSMYELSNDKFSHFILQELIESNENVTLHDLYHRYCNWCRKNNIPRQSKSEIKDKLIIRNIFAPQARVYGVTRQNVIIGYILRNN